MSPRITQEIQLQDPNPWVCHLSPSPANRSLNLVASPDDSEAAEACIEEGAVTGIPLMAMYVDMDNLKIVNDRYGHDEGDFALKLIAETLHEFAERDNGVIGRLGGDEFACMVWSDVDPEAYKQAIRDKFDAFNETSDKPYYVTASVGIYKVPEGENITLEEALAFADEDLYREKQNRSRKTAKY